MRYSNELNINGGEAILNAGETNHLRLRRVLSHVFSEKAIHDQDQMVQNLMRLLVQRLRDNIHDRTRTGKVDFCSWMNWATFDIIRGPAFGEPCGCAVCRKLNIIRGWRCSGEHNGSREAVSLALLLLQSLIPTFVMEALLHDYQRLAIEKVDDRTQLGSDRDDIFNIFLKHYGTEMEMSRNEIYSNTNLILIAGSETFYSALSGCICFLAQNPQIIINLKNKVRSRFTREEEITFQALSSLIYLRAVLNDTMRQYPAVSLFGLRLYDSRSGVLRLFRLAEQSPIY